MFKIWANVTIMNTNEPILAESSSLLQVRAKLGGWREGGSAEEEEAAEAEAGGQPLQRQLLQLLRHQGILPHTGQEQEQGQGGQQGRLPQPLQDPIVFLWGEPNKIL